MPVTRCGGSIPGTYVGHCVATVNVDQRRCYTDLMIDAETHHRTRIITQFVFEAMKDAHPGAPAPDVGPLEKLLGGPLTESDAVTFILTYWKASAQKRNSHD